MFRPPFELMSRVPWDDARTEGRENQKWILVNVQDPSIFDCQLLNRDLWKHDGIKETSCWVDFTVYRENALKVRFYVRLVLATACETE